MVILIFVLFYLVFVTPALSAPQVAITSSPSTVIVGETFPVTFSVSQVASASAYHYKVIGTGVTLVTAPDSGCGSNYDSCPTVNVGSTDSFTATAYAKITAITGDIFISIRIAQADTHTAYTSPQMQITSYSVPTAANTPTPIPTYVPTATSAPTSTPTPTGTPTPSATPKPSPSKAPTATAYPTVSPAPIETPYNDPLPGDSDNSIAQVAGISDLIRPTPTPAPARVFPFRILPFIFVILGGLLLLAPVIIPKIKKS